MNTHKSYMLILALALLLGSANAQTLNWASLKAENRHLLHAGFGMEYGVVYGFAYGYQIRTGILPLLANLEFSFPAGDPLFDDFKTRIGAQVRWFDLNHFQFSTKIHGIFRRYENDFVRLNNFGSDVTGIIGYYRSRWFAALDVGFDKAIVTHFKHAQPYRDLYTAVRDGWYEPPTGGNFYYGVQLGFSFGKHDLYLRAGKILREDFKAGPTIPVAGQLGYNIKF